MMMYLLGLVTGACLVFLMILDDLIKKLDK